MRSTAVAATTAWRWARRCCPPGRWARCSGARWDTPSTRWRTTALAESTGLSVHRIQLLAFVCGCLLAAAGGALQSRYIGYVSPESFNTSISVGFIIMLVIGGRRSVWGPLVGALVLTPLPELFRGAVQTQHIFYGAALILILRFLPGGLASVPQRLRRAFSG